MALIKPLHFLIFFPLIIVEGWWWTKTFCPSVYDTIINQYGSKEVTYKFFDVKKDTDLSNFEWHITASDIGEYKEVRILSYDWNEGSSAFQSLNHNTEYKIYHIYQSVAKDSINKETILPLCEHFKFYGIELFDESETVDNTIDNDKHFYESFVSSPIANSNFVKNSYLYNSNGK